MNGKKISFVKKKPVTSAAIQPLLKNAINFVSNKITTNTQPKAPYNSTIKTYDMNAAFAQPSSDNVYSSVKPGHVIEYKDYFACDTMKRKNDDWDHSSNKRQTTSNYSYQSSLTNSNYYVPSTNNNSGNSNNNSYASANTTNSSNNYMTATNGYMNVFSNSLDQSYSNNTNTASSNGDYNPNNSDYQHYNYDMFSNLAMLQYSNAYAAAKQNK